MDEVFTNYSSQVQRNTQKKQVRNIPLLIGLALFFMVVSAGIVFASTAIFRTLPQFTGSTPKNDTAQEKLPAGVPPQWRSLSNQRCNISLALPQQMTDENNNTWLVSDGNESWFLFDSFVLATYSQINSPDRDQTVVKIACNENTDTLTTETLMTQLETTIQSKKDTLHPDQLQNIRTKTKERKWNKDVIRATLTNETGLEKEFYFLATKTMIYKVEINIRQSDPGEVQNDAQLIFDTVNFL